MTAELARLKIGELFAGYGGLGLGVKAALGGEVVWYSDVCRFDKDGGVGHHEPHRGACRILAHRFPGVPNLGDVTAVDWTKVAPVDVLTGGSPCQDLSHAGKRRGMTEGTRSNLWVAMREAIAQLRPGLVVWENVRGAYSAAADSEVEPCAGCLGDRPGVNLRALGRVLGDFSDLGYDCRWYGLPASDIGAAHERFRVFVAATDARREPGEVPLAGRLAAVQIPAGYGDPRRAGVTHLPTPQARDWKGHGPADVKRNDPNLSAISRLLPTPTTEPTTGNGHARHLGGGIKAEQWGRYADAVARWERVLGRSAPPPTMTSTRGTQQLAPAFVEWLMGLPLGWITDVPGIGRVEALKALGNGVVPQQATAALREMFAWEAVA